MLYNIKPTTTDIPESHYEWLNNKNIIATTSNNVELRLSKLYPNYGVNEWGHVIKIREGLFTKIYTSKIDGLKYVKVKDRNNNPVDILQHLLVATLYVPNPHRRKYVKHIDGNILNNHYSNLKWVSKK